LKVSEQIKSNKLKTDDTALNLYWFTFPDKSFRNLLPAAWLYQGENN
jgi:hypothetical protein